MKSLGPTACADMLNKRDGTNVWTPEMANKAFEDTINELKKAIPKPAPKASDLSMLEVQGSEGAEGVRLAPGATVVLSACNTGRGEIKAEGVVGIARGFLLANASAAVVSLWSVDDGSTAALMRIKYTHLAEGCTVPQALRLAMLRLARPRDSLIAEDVADGLEEEWKRPMHWAGFLVVGAATRLPSPGGVLGGGGASGVAAEAESVVAAKPFEKWGVNEVYKLVKSIGIGFAEAAEVIKENSVDGKTSISAGFDQYLTMGIAQGGLGLRPMQKMRLKTEIEQFSSPEGVRGGGASGVPAEAESVVAVKLFEKLDVNEVYGLVKSIGYAEAADAIKENSVDGKTLISAGFDQYLTMGIADGGLGLKSMQNLKAEIEQFRKASHSV
jgi:hypothetical protein